jgi:5-formyltetrahydrofolate cyclo-ligase
MDANSETNQKHQLRTSLKARRASASYDPELAAGLNIQLAELCLINGAKRIACYLAHNPEPDTELFIDWALENEIEVLLPVSKSDGSLDWVSFDGQTEIGIFGFAEATGEIVSPNGIDLAIIPALAVDQNGMRLGKGKGYYDRALKQITPAPPIVAVVFDDELIEEVPTESHDHPVDAVATPTRVVHFTERLK